MLVRVHDSEVNTLMRPLPLASRGGARVCDADPACLLHSDNARSTSKPISTSLRAAAVSCNPPLAIVGAARGRAQCGWRQYRALYIANTRRIIAFRCKVVRFPRTVHLRGCRRKRGQGGPRARFTCVIVI